VRGKDHQLKTRAGKVSCYVLKIQTAEGEYELWVDRDNYIVWKSIYVGPKASEGISFQTTITVNLIEAKLNSELEQSLFQFIPPDKAVKVPSLAKK
jgi:hypothetical protein